MAPLTLNLLTGSISLNFTPDAALDLQRQIKGLMERLKAIALHHQQGGRPTPQPAMEYRHLGEVFLEVFCNPNIYPSPFAAKVLLTVRDDKIRVTSEAELPRLIEDLDQFLAANG